MDSLFVEGIAATVSAILVFCGSVWLLLTLVLGPRLAYFVTASVTLGFVLLMGVVWSFGTPLGPTGQLPSWSGIGTGETAADVGFGPAADYPDGGGWFEADPEDTAQAALVAEVEGEATDVLEAAIEKGEVTAFEDAADATVDSDATRLLERDGVTYGAVTFEPTPAEGEETGEGDTPEADLPPETGEPEAEETAVDPNAQVIAVLERDPGNPLGKARTITAGTALVFLVHLFGLSRSEKRSRRVP
ncbi:MAG: hypothetical protein M3273_07625 [Actinomycetota bacterium]|nr:hypothetical protein [Actinomycetota bacterium]